MGPLPTDHSFHAVFGTQGQSKVTEGVTDPKSLLPLKLEHCFCLWFPIGLCFLRNLECPVASSCHTCLCCSSCLRSKFHLPLCPVALGKLVSSRPFLFNCLWPNKGDHVRTMHSSASAPANATMLPRALGPALLTSLSFCFSTEKSNCIPWAKKTFGQQQGNFLQTALFLNLDSGV